MSVSSSKARSAARAGVTAAAAGVFYGAWAAFCNYPHGISAAVEAGLIQAALSAGSTLTLVLMLEALFQIAGGGMAGFLLAVGGTLSTMTALMVSIHWLAGTPNLIPTVAPSIVIGSIFFTLYAWRLRVLTRGQARS
ncbi:hypothetical protein [Haliangium ochraceum]|uniref:hypothetical protein n=1 Tax=Haliangium ochraceum TaxID=80816 RepID=UPI0005D47C6B|nr:hypothetical protein [Haliangium ochraceum]